MAILLHIESATTNCSIAISKDGKTIALKEDGRNGYSHAEKLHVFIDDILKAAELERCALDGIVVSKGPGSYTGLRIGVSAAKGLAYALDIPLLSLPTLDVLAQQVTTEDGVIVAMLDARRMEVYAAVYDSAYNQIEDTKAVILDETTYNSYLEKGKVYFIGNGVEKTKTLIAHPNAIFIDDKLPSANQMGGLAEHKYKISDTEDVAYFEPYYLKDFVAIKPKKK